MTPVLKKLDYAGDVPVVGRMKNLQIFTISFFVALGACKEEPKKIKTHAAVVVFVAGNEAKVFGAKGQSKPVKGTILHESDKIQTGNKTQVDLVLPNNILIRIDHNTTILMQDFGLAEGGIQTDRLVLHQGSVFAKVAKLEKSSSFAIQTPTLVAGVRGTQFMTEVGANGQGKVAVTEGKVAVASSQTGKTTEVKEGEQVQVTEKGSLEQAKIDPATAAKTNELSTVTNIKEQDLQKFQGILGDQQKLLDKASGTEKVKGMMEGNDNRIQQQKDTSKEKVEGLKGQTDTKAQEMKAAQEAKIQENQQKLEQEKQEAQKRLEEAQKNSALEEARKKQEELNKNNAIEEAKKKQEEMFKKFP